MPTKLSTGEWVYSETELFDYIMGGDSGSIANVITHTELDVNTLGNLVDIPPLQKPSALETESEYYDQATRTWWMPEYYQQLDIAKYVLMKCQTDAQIQRAGEELMMYQDRGLFPLLQYLKYLVDTMKANGLIWGVGRGSSVASYVLYLLEVHRVDSMYYDLPITEFLR